MWRKIIADDASQRSIGSDDSLAELAQSAWQLASDYDATWKLREFASSHDSRIFAHGPRASHDNAWSVATFPQAN